MELVYRVLWTDNQEDLLSSAENVFREWSGTIPFELIVVSDEGYQIKEFRRKAQDGNRTTLRVIATESQQIIWVDVENENHDSDLGDLENPRKLVTSLISFPKPTEEIQEGGSLTFICCCLDLRIRIFRTSSVKSLTLIGLYQLSA